jgi:hypothetical protein
LEIEHIILRDSWRGMERLAGYLPAGYARGAAVALLENPGSVLITTGFMVNGRPETDGPPGAFFLGRALSLLGVAVGFVCEDAPLALLRALAEQLWMPGSTTSPQQLPPDFVPFPVADESATRDLALRIMSGRQPGAVVAVERCGRTQSGHYRNINGVDISHDTARVDYLFDFAGPRCVTVGIGDGGNETGMGTLAAHLGEIGISDPVETAASHLVPAAVSNWGAYGVIAYLSQLAGRDLLPTDAEEARALDILVQHGAIDGMTTRAEPSVDGFPLAHDLSVLKALRTCITASETTPN